MPTVRPRGEKFQAIVRIKKHGVLVHQESRTFSTERLARAWGERVEREIAASGVSGRAAASMTFGKLVEQYMTAREEVGVLGRAVKGDLGMLVMKLGHLRVDALTSSTFTEFARKRRRDDGISPATALHNLSIARSVLNAAKPMFGLDVSGTMVSESIAALRATGHVAKSEARERRASDDELDRLEVEFRRIANHPSTVIPMDKITRLAVLFPRRREDLCSMLWADYNGVTMTLRDTKHPRIVRTEVVPVPPDAAVLIESLPRIDERILPYKAESVTSSFVRACNRLGIEDLRFHDLRHEGISRLFEAGLAIQEVALVSGHLSWGMLRRYTHLQPENVVEKLSAGKQKASENRSESS